jgi:DNA-binding HxlR family transcriptional regulator
MMASGDSDTISEGLRTPGFGLRASVPLPAPGSGLRVPGCELRLRQLGDGWTLLVVRDLMFKGCHTFNEFLAGGEGIATNVFANRLARLEAHGIVTKDPDPADGRRYAYRLTEKGIDLAPTLVELVVWAARYERTDAPARTVTEMPTRRRQFLQQVRRDWRRSSGYL